LPNPYKKYSKKVMNNDTKKLIIIGDLKFPNGSASSNYVQNLIKVFIELKYRIIVFSTKSSSYFVNDNNITFYALPDLGGGIKRFLNLHLTFFPKIRQELRNIQINKSDILLSYAITPSINKFVLKLKKSYRVKAIAPVVEWFTFKRYKYFFLNFHWITFAYTFYLLYKKFDILYSISSKIHKHFKKLNCNSFIVPFLTDSYGEMNIQKKETNTFKIIVSGTIGEKTSVLNLLNSLVELPNELNTINKIEVHFTKISLKNLKVYFDSNSLDKLSPFLRFHSNLSYSKYTNLLRESHFLYLVRETKFETQANFPSKGPESMTYGLVPIVTKLGDFEKNYLDAGHNSITIDSNDTNNHLIILNYILNLYWKDYLKLSNNAKVDISNNLNYNNWVNNIEKTLNSD